MQIINDVIYGFVVRRYFDYTNMGHYAVIECDILDSPDDVIDEIVNTFKNWLGEAGDEPLSKKEWESVRIKIEELMTNDYWSFDPSTLAELKDKTVPLSIKVNRVRLSDKLVHRVRERVAVGGSD